jgi:hypothetical protein
MFRQWIKQTKQTEDPAGDFIGDFKADDKAPDDFENLDRLRGYLRSQHACREAIEAAEVVWKRYQRWLRQQ